MTGAAVAAASVLDDADAAADGPKHGFAPPLPGREIVRRRRFPNVPLITHHGQHVRFYDDLVKDRTVVLSLMYTTCTGVCPVITAHLASAQRLLFAQGKRDFHICSITIDPEHDTPERLRQYAAANGVGPGWLFLTGKPGDIDLLRHRLGYSDPDPAIDRVRKQHSGMLRYGSEPRAIWGTCQGSARPEWIAQCISWVLPMVTPRRERR